jgi:hypothetical protein
MFQQFDELPFDSSAHPLRQGVEDAIGKTNVEPINATGHRTGKVSRFDRRLRNFLGGSDYERARRSAWHFGIPQLHDQVQSRLAKKCLTCDTNLLGCPAKRRVTTCPGSLLTCPVTTTAPVDQGFFMGKL